MLNWRNITSTENEFYSISIWKTLRIVKSLSSKPDTPNKGSAIKNGISSIIETKIIESNCFRLTEITFTVWVQGLRKRCSYFLNNDSLYQYKREIHSKCYINWKIYQKSFLDVLFALCPTREYSQHKKQFHYNKHRQKNKFSADIFVPTVSPPGMQHFFVDNPVKIW